MTDVSDLTPRERFDRALKGVLTARKAKTDLTEYEEFLVSVLYDSDHTPIATANYLHDLRDRRASND